MKICKKNEISITQKQRRNIKSVKFWYTEKKARTILKQPRAGHSIALFLTQGLCSVSLIQLRYALAYSGLFIHKIPSRYWSKSFGETICLKLTGSGPKNLVHGGIFSSSRGPVLGNLEPTPPWDLLSNNQTWKTNNIPQWIEYISKHYLVFAGSIIAGKAQFGCPNLIHSKIGRHPISMFKFYCSKVNIRGRALPF